MATLEHNRVQVFFKERYPYIYGAIHVVDGTLENQRFENPFLVAKKRADGDRMFFGTVALTMTKIWSQLDKLKTFQRFTEKRLAAAGIRPIDASVIG